MLRFENNELGAKFDLLICSYSELILSHILTFLVRSSLHLCQSEQSLLLLNQLYLSCPEAKADILNLLQILHMSLQLNNLLLVLLCPFLLL